MCVPVTAVMPIYYALVARRKLVLCDHADVTGNFESVSQSILEQLTASDTQISYQSGRYLFHVVVEGGLTFLCVTEAVFDRAIAFAFLRKLQSELVAARLSQRAEIAGPYGLKKEFEATLEQLLQEFSSSDHLERLQSNVDEVQGIMTANIEKVWETLDLHPPCLFASSVHTKKRILDSVYSVIESALFVSGGEPGRCSGGPE